MKMKEINTNPRLCPYQSIGSSSSTARTGTEKVNPRPQCIAYQSRFLCFSSYLEYIKNYNIWYKE
uniref:Uncharacterized protein n=1 Tax=Lepeophtheirus salmonis TaxID=72036 RepID=A0A0K2UWT3_LEPSM